MSIKEELYKILEAMEGVIRENCKHELENDTLKNYDKYCIHCGAYLGTYPKYSFPEKTNPAK
jgi:hypothetical protein